jgi:hypothetical protein
MRYEKKLSDNIFKSSPLLAKLIGEGKKKVVDGGESIVVPLLYGKNSTVGWYSGYTPLDTTPQEGITSAKYNWKQLGGTVTISGKEARQNSGASQIINLLKAKTDQLEKSMKQTIGEALFSTAGTDSNTIIQSIPTIVAAATYTVGGLAHSSYSWWQAQTGTAASFAANGLAEMRNIFNDCSVQEQSDTPNLIVTTQEGFEAYEKLLQPQERFQSSSMADGGFQNLLFKAVPLTWDYYCTGYGAIAGSKMYFLNTKYLDLYVHKDADMKFSEFVEPENQDAKVAKSIWMGELTASNVQKQGVLTVTAA